MPKHADVEVTGQTVKTCLVKHRSKGLDKREMFGDQTPSNIVWWPNIIPFGDLAWCCLIVYDRVYRVNLKAVKHSVKNLNYFFCSLACLMGDVLFVWTAVCQTCLMRACVPRLLSGLYQLFDLCFIKHVLTPAGGGGGGGVLPEKLVRGVRPASQKPYPIYDQNLRYSLPYLWPDQKVETLFMTCFSHAL